MIGYEAGRFNTGNGSVFLGNQAGRSETNGNRLYITNTDDSTPLIGGDFSTNKVGINTAPGSIVRDLHVTGEMRVTDMVTDNPTFLAGVDNDGDFARITAGTGLLFSGTTLNVSGVGTVTSISTNNGITGGTITSTGTVGLTGQALALHNASTNGLFTRTGAGTVANRTITAGNNISVTNGDGVSGNPTIAVSQTIGNAYLSSSYTDFDFDAAYRSIPWSSSIVNNGVTYNGTDTVLTVSANGTYKVSYSVSFTNSSGHKFTTEFDVYNNGASIGGRAKQRTTLDTNSDSGYYTTVSNQFLVTLVNGDDLKLVFARTKGTINVFTPFSGSFVVERVY